MGDLLTWRELDYPAGRNIQSSTSAAGAGQHVNKLLLHIISFFFLPKSNNSVVIILLFWQACRIAAEDTRQQCERLDFISSFRTITAVSCQAVRFFFFF